MRWRKYTTPFAPGCRWRWSRAEPFTMLRVDLPEDEADRQGKQDAHGDVESSQSPGSLKEPLGCGAKCQPHEAARQGHEDEQPSEKGRLQYGAARSRMKESAGGTRRHEPGFRVDPLKEGRAKEADRPALRQGVHAPRCGDLPR